MPIHFRSFWLDERRDSGRLVAAAQLVPQRSESCRTTHCPVRGLQPLLQGVAAPRESQSHSTET